MTATPTSAVRISSALLAQILDHRQMPGEPLSAVLQRYVQGGGCVAPAVDRRNQNLTFPSMFLDVVAGCNRSLTAMEALKSDLRRLAGPDAETFYPELAPLIVGRERRHIARSRMGVYPDRPDLAEYHTVELSRGWFIGTNIANREKLKFLREACRLRGLQPARASSFSGKNG